MAMDQFRYFNPRAPCGARPSACFTPLQRPLFQSTRPVRGATPAKTLFTCGVHDFNPRAPCGARPGVGLIFCECIDFNPRAPCGARPMTVLLFAELFNFNPRAPCGARLIHRRGVIGVRLFQSTRPVRGATQPSWEPFRLIFRFQSTRPVRGATQPPWEMPGVCNFNPRAPCGARQQKYTKLLYTLLRQKAILRQFHAKRRLLKRFSTYKYRNTFLICSANRMGKICTLPLRTTRSLDLPEGMSACSQSARFCFRTFFPSSKTADYPALDP